MRAANIFLLVALAIVACVAEWPSPRTEVATFVKPGCSAHVWLEWSGDLNGTNWIPIAVTRYEFPITNAAAFFRSRTEWVTNTTSND